ncbi:helix-turn-helix transcriptional regulator [Tistrella mobilis]|uniref:helix-turn-helix domain-containing protein n=1 Tax=Tistrella mobilis TaxID=171437 RepID=UPI003555C07F
MTDDNQHDGPKRHTKPTQKGTEPQKGVPAEKSPGGGSGGPLIAEGGVPDWPPVEPAQIDPEIRSASAQMIDAHVGARLLALRQMREISQHQLGEALGLTFQQVQKYERGLNRISAGRLYIAATFLGVPVAYFFDGLPTGTDLEAWLSGDQLAEAPATLSAGTPVTTEDRQLQDLLVAYARIEDPGRRQALAAAVQNIADACDGVVGGEGRRSPLRRRRGRPPKKRD